MAYMNENKVSVWTIAWGVFTGIMMASVVLGLFAAWVISESGVQ